MAESQEVIQKQMSLLPEYQEKYLKDLLANVYQTDEETGTITGFAAQSPLFGKEIYQTEDGSTTLDPTQAMMDPDGNPIQFYETEGGEYTTDASQAMLDQYGSPIFAVEGGVSSPDVIGFTDPQAEAIARLTGGVDPVTGEQYESMMGSYQPFIDDASTTFDQGVSTLEGTTGAFDPTSYKQFYDPFVEDVIDASYADIDRAGAIEGIGARAEAVGAGAYGGSRQGIVESELQRNIMDQKARTGSQLRSAAYTGAQQQAQSAFENQQSRGQTAAQLFQGLGTGIGALGEATQSLGFQDVNTLFNTGALEQNQLQAEYDVQRAGQLEEAYEPFARFSYMRDILQGVPSSGTSLAASATPQASFMGGALSRANSIYGGQGGSQPILGGLGSIQNVSG
jgi:hypothetical protein